MTVATAVFADASVTTFPPVGAATFRVTVPVMVPPDAIVVGDRARVWIRGPRIARVDFALTPFAVALTIAVVSTETRVVWMLMMADI
jgi:hypothetical protein